MIEFINRLISWQICLSSMKIAKPTVADGDSSITGVKDSSIDDLVEETTNGGVSEVAPWGYPDRKHGRSWLEANQADG